MSNTKYMRGKRDMKKIISALLVFALFISLSACVKKDNKGDSVIVPDEPTKVSNRYNEDADKWTKTHWFESKEKNEYIVKNGTSEYKILVPELTTFTTFARDELVRFFNEATGVKLEVVQDDSISHTANGKYISLGDTNAFKTSGLSVDKSALGRDGTRILTKDKSIYIIGGEDNGVLYGVYDFLKMNFGFEVYYKDCYDLDTGVKEVKLRDYNVTDISDIPWKARVGILQCESQDADDYMFAYRLRTTDMLEDLMVPIHKELGSSASASDRLHNSLFYLPEEQYKSEHPDFYSTQGEQLCYTAHGNTKEYAEMIDICAKKVEQSLKWYPITMNTVHIGIMDNWQSCQCKECKDFASAHNGAESAAVYKFVQDMARKVVDWMNLPENKDYKRDDLQFTFFAYQWTLKPPFEIKDGKVIIADDIVPDSDLRIKPFNAFSSFDFGMRMDDSSNIEQIEYATQWAQYVSDGWSWTYGCFYNDYFCFYDPYTFYEDYYKWLYEQKYQFAFAQFHSRQRGADTGFYTLANYITCKLMWNSSLSTADLIDDYFNAMYSDAADAMKDVFYECRLWFAEAHESNGWGWSSNQLQPTTKTSLISLGFVNTLFNKLDKAYAAIEKYQKDEATYSKLKEHIDIEWLFPAKCAIGLYSNQYDVSEIKPKFKSLCNSLGITKVAENVGIESFLDTF